jgi:hypothetical protein
MTSKRLFLLFAPNLPKKAWLGAISPGMYGFISTFAVQPHPILHYFNQWRKNPPFGGRGINIPRGEACRPTGWLAGTLALAAGLFNDVVVEVFEPAGEIGVTGGDVILNMRHNGLLSFCEPLTGIYGRLAGFCGPLTGIYGRLAGFYG